MSHFVKPRFFETKQRKALERELARLELGDQESRRLFVLALEYELGEYESYVQEEQTRPAENIVDRNFSEIALKAEHLSRQLDELPEEAVKSLSARLESADAFSRRYGNAYVTALATELNRLASACETEQTTRSEATSASSQSGRRFIGLVAEAYRECFEISPTPAGDQPFALVMGKIIDIAGLDIRLSETDLQSALSDAD